MKKEERVRIKNKNYFILDKLDELVSFGQGELVMLSIRKFQEQSLLNLYKMQFFRSSLIYHNSVSG